MKKFNLLIRGLFSAFLIFPYFAKAELTTPNSALVSQNGSWRHKPNFSGVRLPNNCTPYENIKILTQIIVDKNGNIAQPSILKSSGNEQADNDVIRQLRLGKFYPFLKNGMPVVGKITLAISITCMPRSQAGKEQDKQRQEILKQLGLSKQTRNF